MIEQIIAEIDQLFERFGEKTYGESCSQKIHAISCAWHAQQEGASEEMVAAAFLHDIGHFIADQKQLIGLDQWGYIDHDKVGSHWLKQHGFPASVYLPVRYHVEAKRYLAIGQQHTIKLSLASFKTLEQQGGIMTAEEASEFEQLGCFMQALQLRRFDDLGKPTTFSNASVTPWLAIIKNVLKGA